MNRSLSTLLAATLGCALAAGAQAVVLKEGSQPMHSALEGATVKFYLQSDLTGVAVARQCPTCDPVRLKVTPKMSVVDADKNYAPIEWTANLNLGERKADILYFPEDKVIFELIVRD